MGYYLDDGYSGTNFERPAFKRMMEAAKMGAVSCIIVKDFSRLGRDHLEVGNYLERIFPLLGIRFISVNDRYDSRECTGMTGGMSVELKNLINAMYSRDLSKKVKGAMRTRAERGEYMAALVPYGYLKEPGNRHHLVPDEEAADVVREVFAMAAEGKKKGEIVRQLNERGIPTIREHFRALGMKWGPRAGEKEKKLWTVTTIGDMLKNEVYLGRTVWNKSEIGTAGQGKQIKNDRSRWKIVEGTHEALVTQEIFDRANEKAFTHRKKGSAQTGHKTRPIFFCPYCGRRLGPTSWGNGYRCMQASFSGIPGCRMVHADKKKLEEAVLECARSMALLVAEEYGSRKKERSGKAGPEEEIRRLESEKKKLSGKKIRLYEDYRSGAITKEAYKSEYENTALRILEIDKMLPELQAGAAGLREQMFRAEKQEEELKGFGELRTFDREKLATVIDSVKVYSADKIEIAWKADDPFFKEVAGETKELKL